MGDEQTRKEPPSAKLSNAEMRYVQQLIDMQLDPKRELEYLQAWLNNLELISERDTPEYKQCKDDLGWLPFLDLQTWDLVYQYLKANGHTATWEMIEGWFDNQRGIDSILSRVSKVALIRDRAWIIERGLRAHVSGDYVISICVLLPQVEGMIWDLGVAKGIVDPARNSQLKLDENGKHVIDKKGKPEWWKIPGLIYELWGYKSFRDKIDRDYNSDAFRHSILHGRDIHKFDKRRSTQAVMLLLSVIEQAAAMRKDRE